MSKELTPWERFDWLTERHREEHLKQIEKGNLQGCPLPWDRMACPPHSWFDKYTKIYNTEVEVTVPKTRKELEEEFLIFRRVLMVLIQSTKNDKLKIQNEEMYNTLCNVLGYGHDYMKDD